jgi:hypothetical protein
MCYCFFKFFDNIHCDVAHIPGEGGAQNIFSALRFKQKILTCNKINRYIEMYCLIFKWILPADIALSYKTLH